MATERTIELSRRDARRIALLAQRLDADAADELPDGLPGVIAAVDALDALPIDWTPTIAPGHDHLLFTRLGGGYDPEELTRGLEGERVLFEVSARIRPMATLPLLRPLLRDFPLSEGWGAWLDDNEPFRIDVLERLREDGPLAAADIDDTSIRPWRSSGWTHGKNVPKMLDLLERTGDIAVAERRGVVRLYDLAERVYPADLPVIGDEEARAERMRRRLAAGGIIRPRLAGTDFEPAQRLEGGVPARVEGVRGEWRVDPSALDRIGGFRGRTAVLNPLDRLVFDRTRLAELFETDYTLEMYKPKAQRRWGYFAMPVLVGDRVVGKVDATLEREAGRLRVDAVHEDEAFDAATTRAVRGELRRLADWLRASLSLP